MKERLAHWRSPLAATLVLVLLIAAASFVVTGRINQAEEAASFTRLTEEAAELTHSLELIVESDREMLGLIAEMMSANLGEPEEFLKLYRTTGTFFSRLELLLPGDRVATADGRRVDVSGQLSFEEEAALGAHISDRQTDWNSGDYVVRHYVPVKRDGETAAMLCGVIELGSLDQELPYAPYGGAAAIYVIDGATGDYLVDTWHSELGNLWTMGSRPMAAGYDDAQLRQGVVDGESNYVVFVSNTTGRYLYFYYTPVKINQWRVALSVPEELVFASAWSIRRLLNLLLILEGVFFLAYLFWLVAYVRRETGEKQRQLDALSYIYDVEKLLFNAHEHEENVTRSLAVIGRMLPAQQVAFTMLDGAGPGQDYLWEAQEEQGLGPVLLESARALAGYFAAGHREVSAYGPQEVRGLLPDAPPELEDLVSVPVEDADGALCGVLSASGLAKRAGCTAMLKGVRFSFAMLCGNTRTYREMQRQGERDALTGLYNRNRYEQDLPRIDSDCRNGVCCVYLDANGLHELNNSQGHEAGDNMLQTVAGELCRRFGDEYAYRVGGDEFILFLMDEAEERVAESCRDMSDALERAGYHVSVGVAWASAPVEAPERLVKQAEQRMYKAKQEYYHHPARSRRARR